MIPEVGQQVKCYLRAGAVVEGVVQEWGNEVVLKSVDDENVFILHRPADDIMMTKVILVSPEVERPAESVPVVEEIQQAPLTDETVSEEDLRTTSLVKLRQMQAEQERRIITNKLQGHQVGEVRKVKYEQPGFHKKPRAT